MGGWRTRAPARWQAAGRALFAGQAALRRGRTRAQPGVVRRHHLRLHLGGLALPGHRDLRCQPSRGRLGDGRPHAKRAGRRRHAHGRRVQTAATGADLYADRGSQYTAIKYGERLAEAGIAASVGSVGDSYDNALAETINGLYKAEVIHRQSWKSREAVELATLTWVDWYNNRRLLSSIGNIPPAEAEAAYYRQLDESALAA